MGRDRLVCGNVIGSHALIGAGVVVMRDVLDYALMMGTPAHQVGWVSECGQVLEQFTKATACPRCALKYRI